MYNSRPFFVAIGRNVTFDATSIATLDNGEIAIVKPDMTLMTAGETITDAEYFYIAQGRTTGGPRLSPKIQGRGVTKWEGQSYTAATEQVSYIGYNTGGQSINVENEAEYIVRVVFHQDKDLWSERQLRRNYSYTSDATATQAEIATELVALMNADTEFSTYATAAVTTDGVANRGISITAVAQTVDDLDFLHDQVTFSVRTDGAFTSATGIDEYGYLYVNGAAGTTTGANSVVPTKGVGTYAHLSKLENWAKGFEGGTNRVGFPIPTVPSYAVDGTTYDLYSIEFFDRHESASMDRSIDSYQQALIAIPAGGAQNAVLEGVLNPYMNSTPEQFVAVNL